MIAAANVIPVSTASVIGVAPIPSPLQLVPSDAWTRFVRALALYDLDSISEAGHLGCFGLRPRRLVDLGIMRNQRKVARGGADGALIWEADFVPPVTWERFRSNPMSQYSALARSILGYDAEYELVTTRPPFGTRSGTLGVLHVAGAGAFRRRRRLFDRARAVFERTNGIF